MIDVTGIDKVAFAKAVYAQSVPKGMGLLHAKHGELDDATAKQIAEAPEFHMDYVHGRACKMNLREDNGRLLAPDTWYDHTKEQYAEVLHAVGIAPSMRVVEHGSCCECSDCVKPSKTLRSASWEKAEAIPRN